MGDEDCEVVPSGDDVVGLFLGTGIAFSFREFEKNHLRKPSMPVVSSSMRLFATPLLYTQFGMVSEVATTGTEQNTRCLLQKLPGEHRQPMI